MSTLFDSFLGRRLISAKSIVVSEADEEFMLDFATVFELDDGSFVELLVEDSLKAMRRIASLDRVEIWGDFDVKGIRTENLPCAILPLMVTQIEVATAMSCMGKWEGAFGESGEEYVLGVVLTDRSGRALALRTDAEELHVESPEAFRKYLDEWWSEDTAWSTHTFSH